jgi:hypothetical protein
LTPTITSTPTRTRRATATPSPAPTNTKRGRITLSGNGCNVGDHHSGESGALLLATFALLALALRPRGVHGARG